MMMMMMILLLMKNILLTLQQDSIWNLVCLYVWYCKNAPVDNFTFLFPIISIIIMINIIVQSRL
jgi:hypothetical protein